ncbi:GNAT family N-acetyltransferase [Qipengyuania qiaonensis]|uniref:GNAT family N-acetyltransferase n=1 Tax=Qipengyuania qiaonensis TaxID=2867240 RepID=A0ABS7J7P1_9SPHN|nr:GNAT family N-acetyltransferase [Qipengyuania qiaonensis]MBX7483276.1 GNAT family N-acetyltransferase [Qipengyuania qiaonensis]
MPSRQTLRERIDSEIAEGWSITLATDSDVVVGFLATKPSVKVLDQLFVIPKAIGSGTGGLLFAHAKQEMPNGFALYTAATNLSARAFYERAGMLSTHESAHPRTGHPVVWYEWVPDQ